MTVRGRLVDRALTVLACLGALCLAATVVAPMLGVHVLVVRSGSMEPTIATGSIVVGKRAPVDVVRVGDVVSVTSPTGRRVTHRVVDRAGDQLVLKGDANAVVDPAPYRTASVDRMVAHVPLAGYAVGAVTSRGGVLVLGTLALLLVALVVRPQLLGDPGSRSPGRRRAAKPVARRARTATLATVALAGLLVLGPGQVRPGWSAPWTDTAVATASYTSTTIAPATLTCGPLQLMSSTLTWAPVAGATGYRIHYGVAGATAETVGSGVTSKVFTVVSAGTFWVEAERTFGTTTWRSVISNKKLYTVVLGGIGTCLDG